jgi:hypothetical protein
VHYTGIDKLIIILFFAVSSPLIVVVTQALACG